MPCYLFTFHGHGTWMPDNPRGYVHRTRGLQPSDPDMGRAYRDAQKQLATIFDRSAQELLISAARAVEPFLSARIHGVACEPSHVHVLVSWHSDREWKSMRASIRSAMTRALDQQIEKKEWFSDSPSRKRIEDQKHFDHLVLRYLPKHRGEKWIRTEDEQAAKRRTGVA